MYIKTLKKYMSCEFFFNDGWAYHFYKNPTKRASIVYLPSNDNQILEWYDKNNFKYMTNVEHDELWELQKIVKKPYNFGDAAELSKLKKEYKEWSYYGFSK